jgi:hypothetical protein
MTIQAFLDDRSGRVPAPFISEARSFVMRMLHLGLALALLVGWTVAAEAAKPKGPKKAGGAAGVVTAVTKDKNGGSITIQVRQGKKNKNAPVIAKTFKVNGTTTFQTVKKIKGQKGQGEKTAAFFADVHKGKHVRIQGTGEVAKVVTILQQGKKK